MPIAAILLPIAALIAPAPVEICSTIFFEPDSAEIPRSAWQILDRVTGDVEDEGRPPVAITGNSGATRFPGGTAALARRRAEAVRDYLVQHGVAARTIAIRPPDPAYALPENRHLADAPENQNAEICLVRE